MESARNPEPRTRTRPDPKEVRSATAVAGAAAPVRRKYGEDQRRVLASLGRALTERNIPPLDRGLRSIVAQQVKNLLVGGWPVEEIEANALELASKYDRFAGHKRMTSLQGLMERSDEQRQESDHKAYLDRERVESQNFAAALADRGVSLPGADRLARKLRHPNQHDFAASQDDRSSCGICTGPIGVHVRRSLVGEIE